MPKLRHSWSDSQLRDNSLTKIPGGTRLDCHGFVNTKSQGMLNRAVGALRWVGCKVRLTCVGAQHAAPHLGKTEASKLFRRCSDWQGRPTQTHSPASRSYRSPCSAPAPAAAQHCYPPSPSAASAPGPEPATSRLALRSRPISSPYLTSVSSRSAP